MLCSTASLSLRLTGVDTARERIKSVTESTLVLGSKLSPTSHLSGLAEALMVAVCLNSRACGCRHLQAPCKRKACWKGSKPD